MIRRMLMLIVMGTAATDWQDDYHQQCPMTR